MATNGSNNSQLLPKELLTAAIQFRTESREDADSNRYAIMLARFTKHISKTQKDKDLSSKEKIYALFSLEKDAQEFDYAISRSKDKRRDTMNVFEDLKAYWENCHNRDFVVNKFDSAHRGIGKATKPVKDSTMSRDINSQVQQLVKIYGDNRSDAEDIFIKKRQEALRFINKEHLKQINIHLGLEKGEKDKDLGR